MNDYPRLESMLKKHVDIVAGVFFLASLTLIFPLYGNPYFSVKQLALVSLTAVLLLRLLQECPAFRLNPFTAAMMAVLFSSVAGIFINLQMWPIALISISWTAVSLLYYLALSALRIKFDGVILLSQLILIVANLWSLIFNESLPHSYDKLGSLLGHRNTFAIIMLALLPYSICLSFENSWRRFVSIPLSGISVGFILLFRTRSSWIVLALYVALGLIYCWRRKVRVSRKSLLVPLGILAFLLATLLLIGPLLQWQSSDPYLESLSSVASPHLWSGRLQLWLLGLEATLKYPFFGVGAGSLPVRWNELVQLLASREQNYSLNQVSILSEYLTAFTEGGIPRGILIFFILGISPGLLLYRNLVGNVSRQQIVASASAFSVSLFSFSELTVSHPAVTALFFYSMVKSAQSEEKTEDAPTPMWAHFRTGVFVSVSALAIPIVLLHISLLLRAVGVLQQRGEPIVLAQRLWPHDLLWYPPHFKILSRYDSTIANDLATDRLSRYPYYLGAVQDAIYQATRTNQVDLGTDGWKAFFKLRSGCLSEQVDFYFRFARNPSLHPEILGPCWLAIQRGIQKKNL